MNRMRALTAVFAAVTVAHFSACVDERIVYRDRDLLSGIPAAAAGFVGYQDAADKLTVCGNCHVGQQSQWEETAHADAMATLDALPAGVVQNFCRECHSTNERGNASEVTGGWSATQDVRYHDVQCESCHGPGLTHVQNPDATQPLAPIRVDLGLTYGCGECHNGLHHPFVEEWAASGHGTLIESPSTRTECQSCHTAAGALAQFGVTANYLEKDSAGVGHTLPIVCAVCHDPHNAEVPGTTSAESQLRHTISVPDEQLNLCMKCHHKRGEPDLTATNRGPHSPEGPLLLGDAGWWPPNMPIEPGDTIRATHGSQRNPRLCAGCHVIRFEVTDTATGDFLVASVGHLFDAIPCVDAQGAPTYEHDCARSERTFRSCTESGCHGTESIARNLYNLAESQILALAEDLNGQLAQVPASEFSTTDNVYTTAEGARFNYQLAIFTGSVVHNPFLIEALLRGSIDQVERDYGIPPRTHWSQVPRLQDDEVR